MKWSAQAAAEVVGGRIVSGYPARVAKGISTDSRTIKPGEAFIPLRGARFDGHEYLPAVLKKGAAWVMAEKGAKKTGPASATVIEVADTLVALGALAAAYRRKFSVKVAAVTGSVGKSTTKEMIAEILAGQGRVLKNQGNLNNRIGLPQTLFRLNAGHEFAALELGCNESGEIAKLTAIAKPDAGLITCVAPVHLEGLGSLEGVADAKAELIQNLGPRATFILNLDDPLIARRARSVKGKLIGFSTRPEARFAGESLHLGPVEKDVVAGRPRIRFSIQRQQNGKSVGRPVPFYLWTLSRHNAVNALAAAALGRAFGVSLADAAERLHRFHGLAGRGEVIRAGGVFILNDCYNASPVSVAQALETLNWWRGPMRGVAVLGEMLELGRSADQYHREVGAAAARKGLSLLVARGPHARVVVESARRAGLPRGAGRVAADNQEAVAILRANLKKGDWVLVKGSRGLALESVVAALAR